MNTETLDKLRKMKFHGMSRAFKAALEAGGGQEIDHSFTADQLVAHLVDAEWDERHNRGIEVKIRNALFSYKAALVMRFAECTFIDKSENILITGSTGIGKNYLASAFGHHACSKGYLLAYHNVPKLYARLKMAKADGTYLKEVSRIERQHMLILDDFGIKPFDSISRSLPIEIIEDRHGKASLIITSQLPIGK